MKGIFDELGLIVEELSNSNKKLGMRVERVQYTIAGYIMAMDMVNGGCDCDEN